MLAKRFFLNMCCGKDFFRCDIISNGN